LSESVVCPHCGEECPRDEGDVRLSESSLVPIARFTNLAELGYFEELLAAHHVEMAVREVDEFSAMHGQWIRRYILSVHSEDAEQATELMQNQLGADDRISDGVASSANGYGSHQEQWDSGFDHDYSRDDGDLPLDPGKLWVPVALAVLGGGLAIWALTANPSEEMPPSQMLWNALRESPQPMESFSPNGEMRRLQYDQQKGRFTLEEDNDGDGRVDRRRVYSKEALILDRKE